MAKYFTSAEFACKHCNQLPSGGMHEGLIRVLDQLREQLGESLIVSSGYRCPTHNRNIGGASQSYHMKGIAADVYIHSDRYSPHRIAKMALECGSDTAVAYPNQGFVHVDMRGHRADWE